MTNNRIRYRLTNTGYIAYHPNYSGPADKTNVGYGSSASEAAEDMYIKRWEAEAQKSES